MSDWNMGFAITNSAGDGEQHRHRKRRRSKQEGVASTSKPKYSRKPNLEEPKITPPCTECGKTFRSWKALFGHMRCHPERQWRGINPPPNHRRYLPPALTGEDHEVAASLLMLANGGMSVSSDGDECSSCRNVKGCFAIRNREVDHDRVARHKTCHYWDEDMNHGLASLGPRLGRYCALDLNYPPAHHNDNVSSSGLTLDLRLGL